MGCGLIERLAYMTKYLVPLILCIGLLFLCSHKGPSTSTQGKQPNPSTGTQWIRINALVNRNIYALAVSDNAILIGTKNYAALNCGIFRSTDNGANWDTANTGLNDNGYYVYILNVVGKNIFAVSEGSVFLSTNNGASWSVVDSSLKSIRNVLSLAVNDKTIFLGTDDGIFKSNYNGSNWITKNVGLKKKWVYPLAMSGSIILAGTDKGIFRSTDGKSWKPVKSGLPESNKSVSNMSYIDAFLVNGSFIFAAVHGNRTEGGGVFLSTNSGLNWKEADSGLTITGSALRAHVKSFAVSGDNIFAATEEGLFLSSHNGLRWIKVNSGLPDTVSFEALAVSDSNIFVATLSFSGLTSYADVWRRPLSDLSMITLAQPQNNQNCNEHRVRLQCGRTSNNIAAGEYDSAGNAAVFMVNAGLDVPCDEWVKVCCKFIPAGGRSDDVNTKLLLSMPWYRITDVAEDTLTDKKNPSSGHGDSVSFF